MKSFKCILILIFIPVAMFSKDKVYLNKNEIDHYYFPLAIKTNLVYAAAITPNLALEFLFKDIYSLELSATYNIWDLEDNKKWKNLQLMAEMRFWVKDNTKGHFLGAHLGFVKYNFGAISLPYYTEAFYYRYDGWSAGIGIAYGYKFNIYKNWSFEATAGIGVVYSDYDKYLHPVCGAYWGSYSSILLMPTKLGLSLIYNIK